MATGFTFIEGIFPCTERRSFGYFYITASTPWTPHPFMAAGFAFIVI